MAVSFLRGGLIDPELRDAALSVLRRGPRTSHDLLHDVGELLDRPSLRPGQLTPVILRLADKGLLKVSGRGGAKMCSLTLRGHGAARLIAESESGEARDSDIEALLQGRLERDDSDADTRRQVAGFVEQLLDRSGLPATGEIHDKGQEAT